MIQPENVPPIEISLSVNASPLIARLQTAQTDIVFATDPNLADLDDEMDNLYGGSI